MDNLKLEAFRDEVSVERNKIKNILCKNAVIVWDKDIDHIIEGDDDVYKMSLDVCGSYRRQNSAYCQDCSDTYHAQKR